MPEPKEQSSYTLTLGSEEWHHIKVLATLRRQSIRDFVRQVLLAEVERAKKSGEFPKTFGKLQGRT